MTDDLRFYRCGKLDERASVVKYLRERAEAMVDAPAVALAIVLLAAQVAAGKHYRQPPATDDTPGPLPSNEGP